MGFLTESWPGTVVGIIGIFVGIGLYLRSRQKPGIGYQWENITLIGGPKAAFPPEIEIRFLGEPVPSVTASRLVIWNSGKVTLDGGAIVGSDPLRVELSGNARILARTVLRQTRPINGWQLRETAANRLELGFDFLDPSDGIVLEVTHTGNRRPRVFGTIRGMPKGVIDHGAVTWSSPARRRWLRIRDAVIVTGCFLIGSLYLLVELFGSEMELREVAVGGFYLAFGCAPILARMVRRPPFKLLNTSDDAASKNPRTR